MDVLYWKHRLIRTPLEPIGRRIQYLGGLWRLLKHPELRPILTEDRWIDQAMARALRADGTYIDVGAHLGTMVGGALKLAPRGRHFAFEPVPRKAKWLQAKFPEVSVHQMALSDTPGETEFFENISRPGFSSLRRPTKEDDSVRAYPVKVERLDEIIPVDVLPRFIKLDVEGAELGVLRGGVETIRRGRPVMVIESIGRNPGRFGYSHADLYRFLDQTLSYDTYIPREFIQGGEALSLERFLKSHEYPFAALNYIAAPRGGAKFD